MRLASVPGRMGEVLAESELILPGNLLGRDRDDRYRILVPPPTGRLGPRLGKIRPSKGSKAPMRSAKAWGVIGNRYPLPDDPPPNVVSVESDQRPHLCRCGGYGRRGASTFASRDARPSEATALPLAAARTPRPIVPSDRDAFSRGILTVLILEPRDRPAVPMRPEVIRRTLSSGKLSLIPEEERMLVARASVPAGKQ